jgi:hypothetical protein
VKESAQFKIDVFKAKSNTANVWISNGVMIEIFWICFTVNKKSIISCELLLLRAITSSSCDHHIIAVMIQFYNTSFHLVVLRCTNFVKKLCSESGNYRSTRTLRVASGDGRCRPAARSRRGRRCANHCSELALYW